jgi:hypothetical protein
MKSSKVHKKLANASAGFVLASVDSPRSNVSFIPKVWNWCIIVSAELVDLLGIMCSFTYEISLENERCVSRQHKDDEA